MLGVVVVGAYSAVATSLILLFLRVTVGLRVSIAEEARGLDVGLHDLTSPAFLVPSPVHPTTTATLETPSFGRSTTVGVWNEETAFT